MGKSFGVSAEKVIDAEASTEFTHFLEVLHEGKVFSGIFLRSLSDEKSEFEVV